MADIVIADDEEVFLYVHATADCVVTLHDIEVDVELTEIGKL